MAYVIIAMTKVKAVLSDGSTEYIETVRNKQINYLVLEKDRLPYITIDVRDKIPIFYVRTFKSFEGNVLNKIYFLGYFDQGVQFLLSFDSKTSQIRIGKDVGRTKNSVSRTEDQ